MKNVSCKRIVIAAVIQSALLCSVSWAEEIKDKNYYRQQAAKSIAVATDKWALKVKPGTSDAWLKKAIGATEIRAIGGLSDTYLVTIPESRSRTTTTKSKIKSINAVQWVQQQNQIQRHKKVSFTDPSFTFQWHLDNTGTVGGTADINVQPAWSGAPAYTGSGTVVGIVDDGLQHAHPDLSPNYLAAASYDYNFLDADPTPFSSDSHGTAVGGLVAASADGSSCGVGVAYQAQLAGIRLIAAGTSDADEAAGLSYMDASVPQKTSISVFSNSWGPADDGIVHDATTGGAGPLAIQAIQDGVMSGRSGKGVIYTWAAGNGLGSNDNVNYDNYANSRYTIAVGAVDYNGVQAPYSEPGAAMLITSPSSGPIVGDGLRTTDLTGSDGSNTNPGVAGDCDNDFGGTSGSTPIVSGVIALMFEANPNLGWRDVQHILANTAVKNHPADVDWTTNSAGFDINHKYGFGLVDASAAVTMAKTWSNVGAATSTSGSQTVGLAIPDLNPTGVNGAITITDNIKIEHVEVVFNATHTFRGDLRVELTSPTGVTSVLSESRLQDGIANYTNWTFMTVRNWGESSAGTWTIKVSDGEALDIGTFNNWQLVIHGTPPSTKDDVVIDFGGIGLWARMNDASWLKLNNSSPDDVVTGDVDGNGLDDVIADFGSTIGGIFIKRNGGAWAQLHNFATQSMATGDLDGNGQDDIVIDFGGIGLWARMNDSAWLKLNNSSPGQVVVTDMDGNGADDVIADFGSTFGGVFVKRNLGAWSKLHNTSPVTMGTGDLDGNGSGDVIINFGGIGLWARMNNASWLKLHNGSPDSVVAGDVDGNGADDVVASFGSTIGGVWQKQNLGGWSKLNNSAPDQMVMGDMDGNGQSDLIGAFNSTLGGIFVRRNNGSWLKLHNSNPDDLAVGGLDAN